MTNVTPFPTTAETPVAQKIFDIEYEHHFDNDGKPVYDTTTQQGFLAVTPDFIAMTDDAGRVTFFMPSHRVLKAVATGEVETTLATTPISGAAN